MVMRLRDLAEGTGVKVNFSQDVAVPPGYGLAVETVAVSFSGVVTRLGDGAAVTGHLAAVLQMTCGRCLCDVTQNVSVTADERFKQVGDNSGDGDSFIVQHETLDLSPMLSTNLMLNIPLKVLCGTQCKGLCPTCGTDLNTVPCACDTASKNPHFGVLSDIFPTTNHRR